MKKLVEFKLPFKVLLINIDNLLSINKKFKFHNK